MVVARLNSNLKQLVIGDFKNFDTYQSEGANEFKKYIEVNVQVKILFVLI